MGQWVVDLPVRSPRPQEALARTALVVEDDPRLQELIANQLSAMGFHVVSARDYEAAVRLLSISRPQIAFVDIELPTQSGYEVCEAIRGAASHRAMPIVMMSENATSLTMAHAENAGANAFLRKPFPTRMLSRCVESLLRGSVRAPVRALARFAPEPVAAVKPCLPATDALPDESGEFQPSATAANALPHESAA